MHPSRFAASVAVVLGALAWPASCADDKPLSKPPYERLLQGDDAKQADTLLKRAIERIEADDYPGALPAMSEMLALRQRVQGADHHEVVSLKYSLTAAQKVGVLTAEQRAT